LYSTVSHYRCYCCPVFIVSSSTRS